MNKQKREKIEKMLDVNIKDLEEDGDKLTVYVPEEEIAKAIGSGGAVVRSVELALDKELEIEEAN